jgi:hypothetical protein
MKLAKSLQQSAISFLSLAFTSFNTVKADDSSNDTTDEAKETTATLLALGTTVGVGLAAEGLLFKDWKNIDDQTLGKAFKNNTLKHNLLSILGGVGIGVGAWLTPWVDSNQAKLVGLIVTAFDMSVSEIKLILRARQEIAPSADNFRSESDSAASMHEILPQNDFSQPFAPQGINSDGKETPEDLKAAIIKLAKFIQKNSIIKLFATYALGIGVEAVMKYAVSNLPGDGDSYASDEDIALSSAILTNLIWSSATRITKRSSPALDQPQEDEAANNTVRAITY